MLLPVLIRFALLNKVKKMQIGYNDNYWGYTQAAVERHYGWNEPSSSELAWFLNSNEISQSQFEDDYDTVRYGLMIELISSVDQDSLDEIHTEADLHEALSYSENIVSEEILISRLRK